MTTSASLPGGSKADGKTQTETPRVGDERPIHCRVCGGRSSEILPFRYAFRSRHLYGVRCRSCSIVFLEPMLDDEEIRSLYGEEYYTECNETCGAHGSAAYMELAAAGDEDRRAVAARLDVMFRRDLGHRGRLLEVGCGPGFLLKEFERLEWDVKGLEISAYAVRHGREKLSLEVVHGSIEDGLLPRESFDAVLMGDVLEHLPRPVEALRTIHGWMAPGGILVVAVPSTMNLLSARIGLAVYGARGRFKTLRIPPYHLFEYTPRTVRTTLEAAGFDVLRVRQSAVPLSRMGLRGSALENMGKVSLQVLGHITSRCFNRGGDRLTVVARRP